MFMDKGNTVYTKESMAAVGEPPFAEEELAREIYLGIKDLFACGFESGDCGFGMRFPNGQNFYISVKQA